MRSMSERCKYNRLPVEMQCTIYCEAIGIIEEYQHFVSASNHGGGRDQEAMYPQFGQTCSPQVYESLEHCLDIAEAVRRLRLPLLSKDGDIHEDEIDNYADNNSILRSVGPSPSISDNVELGFGGVPNCFLEVTPSFLWQLQPQQARMVVVRARVAMIWLQRMKVSNIVQVLDNYKAATEGRQGDHSRGGADMIPSNQDASSCGSTSLPLIQGNPLLTVAPPQTTTDSPVRTLASLFQNTGLGLLLLRSPTRESSHELTLNSASGMKDSTDVLIPPSVLIPDPGSFRLGHGKVFLGAPKLKNLSSRSSSRLPLLPNRSKIF
ncbi:hypothetical protein KSP39_PZI022261 [Platanthera zijinensis]|uniref:Uncharacterized protein n=1 Tax=Platanthera zijinensis TaxID=2320716 RepID=A0AAP0AV43_9ASPA